MDTLISLVVKRLDGTYEIGGYFDPDLEVPEIILYITINPILKIINAKYEKFFGSGRILFIEVTD